MSITRHPDDSTLMSYAAGSLPGALAAVVAAHLVVCPRCRDEVAVMDLVGGTLLADLPGAAMRLPIPGAPEVESHRPAAAARNGEVPEPLVGLVGADLDAVRWRWISPGIWLRRVPFAGSGELHVFKGAPNVILPEHTHRGSELTMVLRGALVDNFGRYGPGDVCDLDETFDKHTPSAGAEGCICVLAQDRPPRYRSLLARLARPWHGM